MVTSLIEHFYNLSTDRFYLSKTMRESLKRGFHFLWTANSVTITHLQAPQ